MSFYSFPDFFIAAVKNTGSVEWIAIVTALFYVVLATRENAWCWIFGIISAALYIYINYIGKLYLDSWLSLYYCVIGFYGWYIWVKKVPGKQENKLLRYMTTQEFIYSLIIGSAGTILLGFLSKKFTDSPVPFFDAALTSFSLVATFLTTQKILENWLFWILIDAAYIIIYLNRAFPFTALLNLIYTIIAVYGYIKWRKKLKISVA
ncbi:nicotinamide riboside transporter PnuC [soil metagenome]